MSVRPLGSAQMFRVLVGPDFRRIETDIPLNRVTPDFIRGGEDGKGVPHMARIVVHDSPEFRDRLRACLIPRIRGAAGRPKMLARKPKSVMYKGESIGLKKYGKGTGVPLSFWFREVVYQPHLDPPTVKLRGFIYLNNQRVVPSYVYLDSRSATVIF